MNEIVFINAVDGVTVIEDLPLGASIGNGSLVTNHFGMIQNYLDDDWRGQLGGFELTRFRRARLYILGTHRWETDEDHPEPTRLLTKWSYWNQRWLIISLIGLPNSILSFLPGF